MEERVFAWGVPVTESPSRTIRDKLTTFTIRPTHVRIEEMGRGVLCRIIYYILSQPDAVDLFGPTQDLARA